MYSILILFSRVMCFKDFLDCNSHHISGCPVDECRRRNIDLMFVCLFKLDECVVVQSSASSITVDLYPTTSFE